MQNDQAGIKIRLSDVSFYYHSQLILERINASFPESAITAIVGPSGQGKSTLLSVINRLWEEIPGAAVQGRVEICLDGRFQDINTRRFSPDALRRRVGMVFQDPNPLPMSIFKNVAFPLKLIGEKNKDKLHAKVRSALEQAFLWDEVKKRLNADGRTLSGGQQQRLCIARALILGPEVLLLDEPTASLDAEAARIIESLLKELKSKCTLLVVSHYMEQVRRVADHIMELRHRSLLTGIGRPAHPLEQAEFFTQQAK